MQKAPDAREDVCPQCKIRTVFTSGSCPYCGYIFESTGQSIKAESPVQPEKQQYVVHQQFPGAHDAKLEYICPRCGAKADPRAGNCSNCGYIGSMSYYMPQQEVHSHEMPLPAIPMRQQSAPPKPPTPAQREEQIRPCPSCGASVSVDSRYCWQCGNYCGAGRRSTAQSFPTSALDKTKNSIISGMSSAQPAMRPPEPVMYRAEEAAVPSYNAAPYVTTPRDIPITDLEYPGEAGYGREKKKKAKRDERKEQAYPGEKKKFPTGLLAAILVVAVALVGMVIFTVSQIMSNPTSPSTVATVADTTPPKISGIGVANVTNTSATIEWTTDEKATSQIMLCFSDTCTYTDPDSTLVKNHSVILNDIQLDVMYKITVISQDSSGNESTQVLEQKFVASSQPDNTVVGLEVGNRAPDFTLKDLNGADVKLSDFKGKIVILNFWRVDCAPCVAELPYMQQIYETWSSQPLEIVAVNLGENPSAIVQPFITSKGYTFTVLLDSGGTVKSDYQVTSWPRTFFIDSNGVIKEPVRIGEFATKAEIEAILNGL